jgi:GntR family transcriptional regulator of arabinose operon
MFTTMETIGTHQLKYIQIMEDLKESILTGQVQPGDKLPSENQLSREYQVSRQTVRKAVAMLEQAGYVYAEHGRGTFCSELVRHTKTSKNIVVITTYLSDYIFPRIIQGIDEVLSRNGYSIILKNTGNSRAREAKILEELLQKDIDGMIIEPSKSHIYCRHMNLYEKLDEYRIPYVFIQGCFSQMSHKPHVLMDDCKGGYMITRYLTELGHKHIVGVFKSDDTQGQNRHKGYVKALQEANVLYDPERVVWFYTEDRTIHPYQAIRLMVEQGKPMDAVVCYNDQIAREVVRALRDCGLRVPEDVSVTGYDNSQVANVSGLTLTTIKHPQEQLGEMAAELLLNLIHGENKTEGNNQILVEPQIVIGNSCMARKNNL